MNTTQTNERDGSKGQIGRVAEAGSYKLSLFDKVKIAVRERFALSTAEKVKQGKPVSEWRRAILADHEEAEFLHQQSEAMASDPQVVADRAKWDRIGRELGKATGGSMSAEEYVSRTSAEMVKQGKPLSEQRKAFEARQALLKEGRDSREIEPKTQSQFQWRQDKETGVIIIKDNGIDGRSVTNDAPAVLNSLRDFMGNDVFDKLPAVIYHDCRRSPKVHHLGSLESAPLLGVKTGSD